MSNLFHKLFNDLTEGVLQVEPSVWKNILDYYKKVLNVVHQQDIKRMSSQTFQPKFIDLNLDNSRWKFLEPYKREIKIELSKSTGSYHTNKGVIHLSLKDPISAVIHTIEHEVAHEIQNLIYLYKNEYKETKDKHNTYSGLSKIRYSDPTYDVHGYKVKFLIEYDYKTVYYVANNNAFKPLYIEANNSKIAFFKLKKLLAPQLLITFSNNKTKTVSRDAVVQTNTFNRLETKPARKLKTGDSINGKPIKTIQTVPNTLRLYYKPNLDLVKIDINNPNVFKNFQFRKQSSFKRTLHGHRPVEFQTDLLSVLRHLQHYYINTVKSNFPNERAENLLKDKKTKKEFFRDVVNNIIQIPFIKYHLNKPDNIRIPYLKELYKNFVELDLPTITYDNAQEIKKIIQANKQ